MLILGFYPKTAICVCTLPITLDKSSTHCYTIYDSTKSRLNYKVIYNLLVNCYLQNFIVNCFPEEEATCFKLTKRHALFCVLTVEQFKTNLQWKN